MKPVNKHTHYGFDDLPDEVEIISINEYKQRNTKMLDLSDVNPSNVKDKFKEQYPLDHPLHRPLNDRDMNILYVASALGASTFIGIADVDAAEAVFSLHLLVEFLNRAITEISSDTKITD